MTGIGLTRKTMMTLRRSILGGIVAVITAVNLPDPAEEEEEEAASLSPALRLLVLVTTGNGQESNVS
jgi:hypothetical protein